MKKFLSVILPLCAGAAIAFYVLPNYGGNLEKFVEKIAVDWEISLMGMRIILTAALALVLCLLFSLLAKIATWLAIIFVLLAVFAPALLSDVPLISENMETVIDKEFDKIIDNSKL